MSETLWKRAARPAWFVVLSLAVVLPVCGSPEYFNRTAAEKESRPDEVLALLALRPGMAVADLGTGGGYFAMRFARAVGREGTVFAIDVNPKSIAYVEAAARKEGLPQLRTLLVKPGESGLGEGSVDLIFIRNVFHHLEDRVAYFTKLRSRLKAGGRIVIIEHAAGSARFAGHGTDPVVIKDEMRRAGFRPLAEEGLLLPKQSFLVFGL